MKNLLIVFVILFALSACSRQAILDENSARHSVPVNSILTLNQALEFPPRQARIFFQHGQLMPYTQINKYDAYCEFEINTLKDSIQVIQPDNFTIYKVSIDRRFVSRDQLFASLSMDMFRDQDIVGFSDDMYLSSERQPDVRKLSCLQWDDASDMSYLSIREIRQALGNIFTLRLVK